MQRIIGKRWHVLIVSALTMAFGQLALVWIDGDTVARSTVVLLCAWNYLLGAILGYITGHDAP